MCKLDLGLTAKISKIYWWLKCNLPKIAILHATLTTNV